MVVVVVHDVLGFCDAQVVVYAPEDGTDSENRGEQPERDDEFARERMSMEC